MAGSSPRHCLLLRQGSRLGLAAPVHFLKSSWASFETKFKQAHSWNCALLTDRLNVERNCKSLCRPGERGFAASAAAAAKIKVDNPVVDLDGDEMTRCGFPRCFVLRSCTPVAASARACCRATRAASSPHLAAGWVPAVQGHLGRHQRKGAQPENRNAVACAVKCAGCLPFSGCCLPHWPVHGLLAQLRAAALWNNGPRTSCRLC